MNIYLASSFTGTLVTWPVWLHMLNAFSRLSSWAVFSQLCSAKATSKKEKISIKIKKKKAFLLAHTCNCLVEQRSNGEKKQNKTGLFNVFDGCVQPMAQSDGDRPWYFFFFLPLCYLHLAFFSYRKPSITTAMINKILRNKIWRKWMLPWFSGIASVSAVKICVIFLCFVLRTALIAMLRYESGICSRYDDEEFGVSILHLSFTLFKLMAFFNP